MGLQRARRLARPMGMASSLDEWLVERSAEVRPSPADRALRLLSTTANYNRLWLVTGTLMLLAGNRPLRRAGARGLLAVVLASGTANGVAKPLFPRRRPPDESVPFVRRLVKPPVSSSFPSGHSASAAAFTAGVALEYPAAAVVVAPVAAAVAYSRVHIGVHWPSDVVAGAALGAGVAWGTHRWWAVRADEPAMLGPAEYVDPVPGGRGLLLVVNPHSASGAGANFAAELRGLLPAATVLELDPGRDLVADLERGIAAGGITALGVSGGDGTVSCVAGVAVRHGLPLAVFPGGTLNHFARDAGVEDPARTVGALNAGEVVLADTARVDLDGAEHRDFVNTASLGGYPDFVRIREQWERRLGKWPAAALAMIRVLLRARPVHAEVDGESSALWMLFVGNGRYHPAHQVPMSRPEMYRGTLDVRYLRADVPFSRTRLVWSTLTGTLEHSPTYVRREVHRIAVRVTGPPVSLATDGEVDSRARDFVFRSNSAALPLFRAAGDGPVLS
ncbi:phosphatase PAP2 family protein [Nocardia sp. NPDC050697]|uniref:bifunctional phosphatase PAP2/diacylglycerol kinase family protein n=1 Tax=Nocardia sp. NPDC050697 TaxID=3155158 RepID=UPI0034005950